MIKIKYIKENDSHTLELSGHAEYAVPGSDIVCAAVSILYQSLVDKMWKLRDIEAFKSMESWSDNSKSYLHVEFFSNPIHRMMVDELFSMVVDAFVQLSKDYKDNVKVGTLPDDYIC